MQPTKWIRVIAVLAGVAILLGASYLFGVRQGGSVSERLGANVGNDSKAAAQSDRKVLYWQDPMVPGQRFDKPGKSPFMDMPLQPVYADEGVANGISIDPSLQQSLGIRYATVTREQTKQGFDAIGTTQFDESQAVFIQSRVNGFIERLHADAPLQHIKEGTAIASLFVPDWLAPQEEYLALKRGGAGGEMLSASRTRMRALSIPKDLISTLDRTGKVQSYITLRAPVSGVITELSVRNGAMVAPGQTLAKLVGLNNLWLVIEVPESMASRVRPGMIVDAVFSGDSNRRVKGRIREILPGISTSSRTLQARLEIDNTELGLTPGMLMRAHISAEESVSRLLVPSEAVIATGERSVVIVKNEAGRLQPVQVELGIRLDDMTEILRGLREGQQVVASGQFLIDSEANLRSILPKLQGETPSGEEEVGGTTAVPAPSYGTTGKIEQITADGITFSHQAVPALNWPAMTMMFSKPDADAFPDVKLGQTARFSFKQSSDGYQLLSVDPVMENAR
ncbi:efflux RND transporter periplasmic adaptor subunit [Paenalcaligenes niemegkensis]|uniref:efflux RND transporter periplasmic adaptor subunit n=1 Tax=Paenalcaligenes niemegkensis TaxID=2895469 RepID=UPI001EE93B7D|nr:efflux RND transporter periplasmic adaptor subunit [Paenalcaligenes niemegkensis]MCQ9617324.1 efflux RND transporter periplasmic adaptor subunit [Paenalcaligenes niemegkensis]